jgi:hypothetical protein
MGLLTGPLINISTDQMATPVDSANGGIRQKFVTGTITRLVAGEIVNVYFITEPSSPWVDQKPSIRVIKFNSGMGRTGLLIAWGGQGYLYSSFGLRLGCCLLYSRV